MKNVSSKYGVCVLVFCYISTVFNPVLADVRSTLPADLVLDESAVAAIQQCLGDELNFTQRYHALVKDNDDLQQKDAAIVKYKADIQESKVNLDREEGLLNSFAISQRKMAGELEALRNSLYRNHATKPLLVEEMQRENVKIESYNKMSGEYNVMTDQYNKLVIAQKQRIADHNTLVASLNAAVASYNAQAIVVQNATNQSFQDVASYQGKCAKDKK